VFTIRLLGNAYGTIRGIMNQEFKTEWQKYNEEHIQKPMWDKLRQMAENLSE